jgi:hypothetical protein
MGSKEVKEGVIITVPSGTELSKGLPGGDNELLITTAEFTRLVVQSTPETIVRGSGVVAVRIGPDSLEKGKLDPGVLYLAEEKVKAQASA